MIGLLGEGARRGHRHTQTHRTHQTLYTHTLTHTHAKVHSTVAAAAAELQDFKKFGCLFHIRTVFCVS